MRFRTASEQTQRLDPCFDRCFRVPDRGAGSGEQVGEFLDRGLQVVALFRELGQRRIARFQGVEQTAQSRKLPVGIFAFRRGADRFEKGHGRTAIAESGRQTQQIFD